MKHSESNAIVNQKRGVAKLTTTHNLVAALAATRKKVLIVQDSLTISVGLEPLEAERTIVDMLRKDGDPIRECIYQIQELINRELQTLGVIAMLGCQMIGRSWRY